MSRRSQNECSARTLALKEHTRALWYGYELGITQSRCVHV